MIIQIKKQNKEESGAGGGGEKTHNKKGKIITEVVPLPD